jgi:hypothetical protein
MGTLTTNYNLIKPALTDSMANFTDINSSWDTLNRINSSRVVATLPTVGTYQIGDRVYLTPDKSTYVCVCNDVNWGIIWRPVFKGISPWRNVGTSALLTPAQWNCNDAGRPLQIALDNQGNLYFRGVLKYTDAASIPKGAAVGVFNLMPNGIQPRSDLAFMIGHDNLTVTTTGLAQWEGAMLSVRHDNLAPISITPLGGNGTGNERTFYFDGQVEWAIGTGVFTAP